MTEVISIEQIYEELKMIERTMATKEDVKALADTIGILSNPETMLRINESEKAIKEGKVKEVTSVQDMLDEIKE